MKTCYRCRLTKPLEAFFFNKNEKDGRDGRCRECWKVIRRARHEKDGDRNRQKASTRRKAIKTFVKGLKSNKCCARCGFANPAALDFHHHGERDPGLGRRCLASVGWSIERILAEVEKCELICANCHRIEHHGQFY